MIAVTGATGNLGRLVIEELLEADVPPSEIVAAARSPEKAADLARRGVKVREADYTRPDTLESAFEGVDRLLLISSSEVGQRLDHHRNVLEAAQKADIEFLAYTSILDAEDTPIKLADEHKKTERLIRESDLAYAFLRNGWYIENYTAGLEQTLESGAIAGSAGDGRISAATRSDFAAAAAIVLMGEGHEGAVYELGGDEAFTMSELASEITEQSGTKVVYHDLPQDEYEKVLKDAGLPAPAASTIADADAKISDGHLYTESDDLRRLIGRPTTPLSEALSDALKHVN